MAKLNPIIDPGDHKLIHRQPHTPGPDPTWKLNYVPPDVSHSLYAQDGSDGGSSLEATSGVAYLDGSGGQ